MPASKPEEGRRTCRQITRKLAEKRHTLCLVAHHHQKKTARERERERERGSERERERERKRERESE